MNALILGFFVCTKLDTEILNVQRLIFAIREMAALLKQRVISSVVGKNLDCGVCFYLTWKEGHFSWSSETCALPPLTVYLV
jgi:hypothetical protein